jgi:hypothetical protein
MSSDIDDFYVQRSEPLGPLLPTHVEWDHYDDEHVVVADDWQLMVYDPEPVEAKEIPDDLRHEVTELRFRVSAVIEPINPPDEAWDLMDAVLDAIGAKLGGATYDIRTGRPIAWHGGRRVESNRPRRTGLFGRFRS